MLGLPFVSPVFQAYAAYPPFLEMHWTRLRPVVNSREFFQLADRLRADAYTRVYSYLAVPNLRAPMEAFGTANGWQQVNEVVELFHQAGPLLLLIASAQLQAFDNPVGQHRPPTLLAERPTFSAEPMFTDERGATVAVRKLYEDIKRTTEMPLQGAAFLALGRWPRFLALYWDALKRLRQTPIYHECASSMRQTAWSLTAELPGRFELTPDQLIQAGMNEADAASLVRITDLFVRLFSALTLNISVAKIGLEGGTRSARSAVKRSSEPQAAA